MDWRRWVPVAVGIIAIGVLTALCAAYTEIPDDLKKNPDSLWLRFLSANRLGLLLALAFVGAVMQVFPRRRASSEAKIRASVKWYLEHIHRRNWPPDTKMTGFHSDFRVSLFVPNYKKKHLACVHRTVTGTPKAVWPMDPDNIAEPHGLVGVIFALRMGKDVASPSPSPTQGEIDQYLQATYMSREEYATRSWKRAAMRGFPVHVTSDAEPVGVLLMECKRPGFKFPQQGFDFDVEVCGKILTGVLTVEKGGE